MAIPTQAELLERKRVAEERLHKARAAYDTFSREWAVLEKEESELLKQLSAHVDKSNIYAVLKKIEELKG